MGQGTMRYLVGPLRAAAALAPLSLLGSLAARAADEAAQPPHPFEAEIAAFEAQDRATPPPAGAILFVGSSSIRLWDLQRDFPDLATTNRGFGGSQMSDAAHFAERVIVPYAPRLVVLYEGDNDLASGKMPEDVLSDLEALLAKTRLALPETRWLVLSVKPSLARWHLVDQIRKTNDLLQAAARRDERLIYVDVFSPMLDERGEVAKELLAADGLHLSRAGYDLWTAIVRPCLVPTPRAGPQRFSATTDPSVAPQ